MNYLLIVDDSTVDSRRASGLLQKIFHERIKYAEHGWAALELMSEQLPLAVITDLQMPELDGLQLTERIRQQYPTVPVILMTAHGSEDIAAQALARGAVDFVPKSQMATELAPAVANVLSLSAVRHRDRQIDRYLRREMLEFEFGNDLGLIPPLVFRLRQAARNIDLVDESRGLRLAKALTEALRNAICHGNLELSAEEWSAARNDCEDVPEIIAQRLQNPRFQDRHVGLTAHMSPEQGEFQIRDDGEGFETASLPNISHDPSQLTSNQGRGLLLMQAFADELRFNDRGNEVTMIVRRSEQNS